MLKLEYKKSRFVNQIANGYIVLDSSISFLCHLIFFLLVFFRISRFHHSKLFFRWYLSLPFSGYDRTASEKENRTAQQGTG